MSRSDVLPFPKAPAAACQALDTAMAQAAVDPAAAWTLALPLLGQPALHISRPWCCSSTSAAARATPGRRPCWPGAPPDWPPASAGRAPLAAMALCEDGRPEAALGHALAAFTLAPDDPSAQTAVLAGRQGCRRPLAGLDAAVALCATSSPSRATTALAVSLLDACAGGPTWGAVWPDGVDLAGCVRRTGPLPPEVILLADGVELGRTVADRPGSVPISGFSLAPAPGLPAHTRAEVVLAETDTALFGSPVVLADAQPAPRPSDRAQACAEACPARGVAAQPAATPQALAQLNGWLRQAALSQAPPPCPRPA